MDKIDYGGNTMKIRRIAIFGFLAVFAICALFQGAVAADNDTFEDSAAFGVSGIGGELISTVFWVAIGLLLIIGSVGIVDLVTDRMKHNWLNLEELAGQPTAMAIIAAGLMVAIAIIIHGATLG